MIKFVVPEEQKEAFGFKNEPDKADNKKLSFLEDYGELSERQLLLEMLYAHELKLDKLERIRRNTNKLVWWLIVLPLLAGFLIALFS